MEYMIVVWKCYEHVDVMGGFLAFITPKTSWKWLPFRGIEILPIPDTLRGRIISWENEGNWRWGVSAKLSEEAEMCCKEHSITLCLLFSLQISEKAVRRLGNGLGLGVKDSTTDIIETVMQAHQKFERPLVFNNGSVEFLILGAFSFKFLGEINFLQCRVRTEK